MPEEEGGDILRFGLGDPRFYPCLIVNAGLNLIEEDYRRAGEVAGNGKDEEFWALREAMLLAGVSQEELDYYGDEILRSSMKSQFGTIDAKRWFETARRELKRSNVRSYLIRSLVDKAVDYNPLEVDMDEDEILLEYYKGILAPFGITPYVEEKKVFFDTTFLPEYVILYLATRMLMDASPLKSVGRRQYREIAFKRRQWDGEPSDIKPPASNFEAGLNHFLEQEWEPIRWVSGLDVISVYNARNAQYNTGKKDGDGKPIYQTYFWLYNAYQLWYDGYKIPVGENEEGEEVPLFDEGDEGYVPPMYYVWTSEASERDRDGEYTVIYDDCETGLPAKKMWHVTKELPKLPENVPQLRNRASLKEKELYAWPCIAIVDAFVETADNRFYRTLSGPPAGNPAGCYDNAYWGLNKEDYYY